MSENEMNKLAVEPSTDSEPMEKKPETKKRKRKKKSRVFKTIRKIVKWIVLIALLLAAVLIGLKLYIKNQVDSSEEAASYSRTSVVRGAMEETVYGTGTTSALNQPNILAEADGTLTDLRVTVGDEVKAGEVLAVITNEEIDDTITDLEFALWELDDEIADTKAGSKVYSIQAPVAGRVMALYAEVGDDTLAVFRREGALALISTDGRMKVTLESDVTLNVALNDKVQVVGESVDIEGTVTDLTHQGTHATITILSDELPMGEVVTIKTLAGETLGQGELEINKPMAVSSYGGTVERVAVTVGSTVKRETVLYWLEDSPLTLTVENLRLQRESAAKELEDAKAQRENLIVVAPCDGVVATLDVAEGDEITSGTLLGSILQGEDMSLTIAVDELDVVEVEVGQKVVISVDALSDVEFEGAVSKVSPVGTNSGGVTTYDVELAFEATGSGVRSGMNATGEIQVASVDDTLYVPVEALMTINNETYVMVEGDGTTTLADAANSTLAGQFSGGRGQRSQSDSGEMPDMSGLPDMGSMPQRGAAGQTDAAGETAAQEQTFLQKVVSTMRSVYAGVMAWLYEGVETDAAQVTGSLVKVEVGLQNDDYAQILSGLNEGAIVLYTASEETTSSAFGSFGGDRGGNSGFGAMPMGF